jgi:NAD(P)-dependent dehydrogenase (short-subunit alcohol dehydrogenase family)
VAILARDAAELARGCRDLRARGIDAVAERCDVRDRADVDGAIDRIARRLGRIDVLVNNAGVIQAGPLAQTTLADFEDALRVHLFGPLATTFAVLPHLRRTGGGRIVNIVSLGGLVGVPHLVPYSASKFALAGLSQGLRAELRRENIRVTTVHPALMRTGSPRNALFKGRRRAEHAWFAIADAQPLLSVSSGRAARRIVAACRRGDATLTVGWPARVAMIANGLAPNTVAALTAAANRFLPDAPAGAPAPALPGHAVESRWAPSPLTRLSDRAAPLNNEVPPLGAGLSRNT